MDPKPKTLLFNDHEPRLVFDAEADRDSPVSAMVDAATVVLRAHDADACGAIDHRSISLSCIQYESPTGAFAPHVDHCANSLVYLLSLGCAANFVVQTNTIHGQQGKFQDVQR